MTFYKTQLRLRKHNCEQMRFRKYLRKYNSTGNGKQNISKNMTTFHKTQHLTKHIDISVNTFYKTNNVTVFCDLFFFCETLHSCHMLSEMGFFFPKCGQVLWNVVLWPSGPPYKCLLQCAECTHKRTSQFNVLTTESKGTRRDIYNPSFLQLPIRMPVPELKVHSLLLCSQHGKQIQYPSSKLIPVTSLQ